MKRFLGFVGILEVLVFGGKYSIVSPEFTPNLCPQNLEEN